MPTALRVLVAVLLTLAAVFGLAQWRWNRATASMRGLLVGSSRGAGSVVDASEFADLPAPVARYLRLVLNDPQRVITHARIAWVGEFNTGAPGADRWSPFSATQDFVPGAPGMIWDARIRMAPGVTVRVRDGLVDARGSMFGAVLAVYPVVNRRDTPELTVAAMQRYLAEAVWLPTALLPSQGVGWQAVDESHARATLRAGTSEAVADFLFGADGLVCGVHVPDRIFDDGKHAPARYPWQGRYLRFGAINGLLVPVESVVEWQLPDGPFAYWRGKPVSIEYSYDEPR